MNPDNEEGEIIAWIVIITIVVMGVVATAIIVNT